MKNLVKIRLIVFVLTTTVFVIAGCSVNDTVRIYVDKHAGRTEDLAARELRKYIYQRTGKLFEIQKWDEKVRIRGNAIFVGTQSSDMMQSTGFEFPGLASDDFILRTISSSDGKRLLVCGGSRTGTLYAAYHLAESMGIGFYLDGDVIPDRQIKFVFPELDVKQSPLFSRRGIQPFHDFPEGPDWWNREDYRAVLAQLPKMKMNFIGFHTYPEGGVGPEPLTWIGLPDDVNTDGKVRSAYHSRHFTTLSGSWGTTPKKTSEYSFGAAQLFSRDDFGADYMKDRTPWPKETDEVNLFNEMGDFLNDVLSFAKDLDIKTCLGTEIPLVLPDKFIKELKLRGLDPESPHVREKIYEGIFTRIKRTHPLDFYWFWTPENWTWSGNSKKDIDNTLRDFNAAVKALNNVKPGFSLATCGWVLGPASDRALFDNILPKDIAFSCINRNLGWEPVDSAFIRIQEREKWAIPWMEDDPGLTIPQLWAGRMRRDAADASSYGCNGFFGIHWRTRELSMNVSALAKAAWEEPWNPQQGKKLEPVQFKNYLLSMEGKERKIRDSECASFYADWCRKQFGEEVSDKVAAIFTSLDGVTEKTTNLQSGLNKLPRPADWINGPGGIAEKHYSWDSIEAKFVFIPELEDLRKSVAGSGNLERYDFWLNQFRYLRAFEKLACAMHDYALEVKKIGKVSQNEKAKEYNEKLIPIIKDEAGDLREIHKYLISALSTWGGLGNITNWQQHNIEGQIMPQIRKITKITGDSAWIKDLFPANIPEISRIIVPSPQTIVREGDDYHLRVICFNVRPSSAKIFWRKLGDRDYMQADLRQISGTWLSATIPSGEISGDFEYYIKVNSGRDFIFPASAPDINMAVTVLGK